VVETALLIPVFWNILFITTMQLLGIWSLAYSISIKEDLVATSIMQIGVAAII
jgi:uncharacterized membrane protein